MAFTSAGLPNSGKTAHYQFSYNTALSTADGHDLALGLFNSAEADFNLMAGWFSGVNMEFNFPLPVQIVTGPLKGAGWNDPADIVVAFGTSPTVSLQPGTGAALAFLRYLLVSEVTEMFMASQKKGWYQNTSLFYGADEGSKGEGLSRFLGVQMRIVNGLGNAAPPTFGVTAGWINSPRQDFVTNNPDDNKPDPTTGCTTLFLFFLRDQLNFTPQQIIAAGASNLAGVYQKLTGKTDAWPAFSGLVNSHYPPSFAYNPPGETVFPVSNLSQFQAPNQITCGYSASTFVYIDRPAAAQVNITLKSDDPAVTVPAFVTIPPGANKATVVISAPAISGPFAPKTVNVHATYAGQTVTIQAQVVPPKIVSLTVNPSTVTVPQSVTATVTLDRPSLLGPVVVDIIDGAPGFATAPAQVTIPQNQISAQFVITTPNIQVAFKTATVSLYASYSGSSASATLLVQSQIVAGILASLTILPTTIPIGYTSHGSVVLVAPVPVPTIVGLGALEPIITPNGPIPGGPGNPSTIASVPGSITIPAGQITGSFTITTHGALTPGTKRSVQILATAVTFKYAGLQITAS